MSYLQEYRDYYTEYADLDDWSLTEKLWGENPDLEKQGWDLDSFGKKLGATERPKQEKDRFSLMSLPRGLASGYYQTKAMVPGLLSLGANIVGAEDTARSLAQTAREILEEGEQYRPRTEFRELFSEPTVAGVLDNILYQLGNLAPSMLLGGVGGAIGRGVAGKVVANRLAKGSVQNILSKKAEKFLLTDAGKKLVTDKGLDLARKEAILAAGQQVGTSIGVVAAVSPMETSGMYMEDVEKHGVEGASPISDIVFGTAAGSLEIFGGHMKILNRILGNKAAKKATKDLSMKKFSRVGRVLKEAVTIGGQESLQELGQEELALLNELWNADDEERQQLDYWSTDNMFRRGESAFAGLVGGIIPGAGSGIVNELKRTGFRKDVIDEATDKLIEDAGAAPLPPDDPSAGGEPGGPLRTATARQAYIDEQERISRQAREYLDIETEARERIAREMDRTARAQEANQEQIDQAITEKEIAENQAEMLQPDTVTQPVDPEAEILRNENIRSQPEFERFAEETRQTQDQVREDVGLDEFETDVGYTEENEFYEQARDHIERVQARTKALLAKPVPDVAKEPTIAKLAEVQEISQRTVEARAEVDAQEQAVQEAEAAIEEQLAQEAVQEPAPVIEEAVPTPVAPTPDLTGIQVSVPETDQFGKPLISKGKQRMGMMDATEAVQTVDKNINTYQQMLNCLVT